MKARLTTQRFILRDLEPTDAGHIFTLDSDPRVHEFLGKNPLTKPEQAKEVIELVRKQYIDNGIGRWAVIDKNSGAFLGWCGLKHEENVRNFPYYDIGYRFMPRYWGKGVATETAKACLAYGYEQLRLNRICGAADLNHAVSNHILQKVGLKFVDEFTYEQIPCNFYALDQSEWKS